MTHPKGWEWLEDWIKEAVGVSLEPAALEHTGVKIMAHLPETCAGQPACPIHNRSIHMMRAMDQHWRSDRGIVERMCEHGVSHPDPDQYHYWVATMGREEADAMMVHGCDGCGH